MIDLHPPISGLPLASIILLVVAELSALSARFGRHAGVLRTVGAAGCLIAVAAAFASGYQASSRIGDLTPQVEAALGWHHFNGRLLLFNSILLVTFFILSRIAKHNRIVFVSLYYLALIIQIALTIMVGFLGGELVFGHGVNVRIR